MHDTDRVIRQAVPPPIPLRRDFIDLTPTTQPSWATPPPTRLARGTSLPPIAREAPRTRRAVPKVSLEAIGLPWRVVALPRRWGDVVIVGLDGVPLARPRRARRARPADARRPTSTVAPLATIAALAGAAVVLVALLVRGPTPTAAAPRAAAQPAAVEPTITPLPRPTITPLREIDPALAAPPPPPIGFTRE